MVYIADSTNNKMKIIYSDGNTVNQQSIDIPQSAGSSIHSDGRLRATKIRQHLIEAQSECIYQWNRIINIIISLNINYSIVGHNGKILY